MKYLTLLLLFVCASVAGHEWTPTYFKLYPSYAAGIHVAKMKIYNSRADVEYYQVQVFDGRFNPIKFAISGGEGTDIIHIPHRQRRIVDVYVPSYESSRVVYICTRSMIVKRLQTASLVSSRICSKAKG